MDIEKLFAAARDDNTLYDWKDEEERTQEVKQAGFDKYPLKPVNLDIELTLDTLPDYGDGLLEDCPKTKAIIENACKVLEKKFVKLKHSRAEAREMAEVEYVTKVKKQGRPPKLGERFVQNNRFEHLSPISQTERSSSQLLCRNGSLRANIDLNQSTHKRMMTKRRVNHTMKTTKAKRCQVSGLLVAFESSDVCHALRCFL